MRKWTYEELESGLNEMGELQVKLNQRIRELEADREAAVQLVLAAGLSTGHADNFSELMKEVLVQYTEIRARAEAAEIKVAELMRGEYICKKCGLRKDSEPEIVGDF